VPVENYYKGVRCDWWCPKPDKGMPVIDPPTEEGGCLCEIPDRRPKSEQIFDNIDAFLGGFKANEGFANLIPCFTSLRSTVGNMNNTLIAWEEMKANATNITLGQKIETYLFNTTKWISYDLAPDLRYCYGVGLDAWGYVTIK
jgi:hypothetical protein